MKLSDNTKLKTKTRQRQPKKIKPIDVRANKNKPKISVSLCSTDETVMPQYQVPAHSAVNCSDLPYFKASNKQFKPKGKVNCRIHNNMVGTT